MAWAHITDGAIDAYAGKAPSVGVRQDTGQTVSGIQPTDTGLLLACGWQQIVPTTKPTPAAGNTLDRSIELPGGVPTETWTERPMTQAELDAEATQATQNRLEGLAVTAVPQLRQIQHAPTLNAQEKTDAIQDMARILRRTIVLVQPDLLDDPDATA